MTTNLRGSGLLLHPTSLPGPHGVGDLGGAAYRFVDFLRDAGQSYWQMLPIGPLGMGSSPYRLLSAFAGSELLISLDKLADRGHLDRADLVADPPFRTDRVDYGNAARFRFERLWRAFQAFESRASDDDRRRFETFRTENAGWLGDYARFSVLKSDNGRQSWTAWPEPLRRRDADALSQACESLATEIRYQEFLQFQFASRWFELRDYAHDRGVRLIGDLPFYVAHDSADAWGHPLYRWDHLRSQGYAWWIERLRIGFDLFDILRLDHFIAFVRYFEIRGDAADARVGEWRPGPGAELFEKALEAFGSFPVIAENLGPVTPEVDALRDRFRIPGMRILQFGLGDDGANPHNPDRYDAGSVVYTGNHDTDPIAAWFARPTGADGVRSTEGNNALNRVGTDGREIHWDLIRLAAASVCEIAIFPVQDILGLGADARMNTPGKGDGNWEWRFEDGALTGDHAARLRNLTESSGRLPRE